MKKYLLKAKEGVKRLRITKRQLFALLILFLVYFLTAYFSSVIFRSLNTRPFLLWPPAGIAMAGLFLEGYVLWPAVALGAFVNSVVLDFPPIGIFASVVGSTTQALIGAYLLRRFRLDRRLLKLRDIAAIMVVACTVTAIQPTLVLTINKYLGTLATDVTFLNRWLTVWLGGVLSVMILTPFIVSLTADQPENTGARNRFELVSVVLLFLVINFFVFWTPYVSFAGVSLVYVMLIPLFWIALRFGPRWMSLAMLLMAIVGITAPFFGFVDIPQDALGRRLLATELFIIIIGIIYFVLAGVSEERKNANITLTQYIGQLENALQAIKHYALHDSLTGLANRNALEEHFVATRVQAEREGVKFAVLFLDLDNFKHINDTLGHTIGDCILKEVASRLRSVVRSYDLVARLGGDEFIMVLNQVNSRMEIEPVLKRIAGVLQEVIHVQQHTLQLTASIGVAMFPESGDNIDAMLKSADIALYRAKDKGKDTYVFYEKDMQLELHTKLALQQDLRQAVDKSQFELLFQPYFDLTTKKLKGLEALIRWNHPQLGTLSPHNFIPLAEETGLIIPMGLWILQEAASQAQLWLKQGFQIPVSVNLSPRQFVDSEMIQKFKTVLRDTGLDPKFLEFEITESVAMHNQANAVQKLRELRDLGALITLDDFGTGYSSLSYLKNMPIEKVKIDQSFVRNIITDPQDSIIISTIISLGHSLGFQVCAEGIETEGQRDLLESLGSDMGQGYLMCRPLAADDMRSWLQNYYHTPVTT